MNSLKTSWRIELSKLKTLTCDHWFQQHLSHYRHVVGMMTWIVEVNYVVDLLIVAVEGQKCRFGAAVKLLPVGLLSPLELTELLLPFHSDDVIFFMIFSPEFFSTRGILLSSSFWLFFLFYFFISYFFFLTSLTLFYSENFTIMRKKNHFFSFSIETYSNFFFLFYFSWTFLFSFLLYSQKGCEWKCEIKFPNDEIKDKKTS